MRTQWGIRIGAPMRRVARNGTVQVWWFWLAAAVTYAMFGAMFYSMT